MAKYSAEHIPGETKHLDGATYIVSPKGNWVRQTTRKSKKAMHREAVAERLEKKRIEKLCKKLDVK